MGLEGSAIAGGPAPARHPRAYAKAQRHSRRVRFYKRAIPFGAVLGILVVGTIAVFDPFRRVEGLTVGPVSVSGTQVTMESPKLTGFKNDSRPYEVTASAAMQDVRQPNLVELKQLRARIVTDDQGGAARLEAAIGVLDTQKERMELRDDVRVRTDSGQEVQLRSASVNFKAGTVVSNEPVTVMLGNGLIKADRLEVEESGKVLHFIGRVQTTFDGTSEPTATSSSSAPQTAQPTDLSP